MAGMLLPDAANILKCRSDRSQSAKRIRHCGRIERDPVWSGHRRVMEAAVRIFALSCMSSHIL